MTLRLSALFETKVDDLLSHSDARKTRKQKPKGTKASRYSPGSVMENPCRKYSVSSDGSSSRQTHDNSLRLVLRRNGDCQKSIVESTNTNGPASSSSLSVVDTTARSGRTVSRRTGVFINLQTGRARDLSDGDGSHIEDDSPTSQILSPKDEIPVPIKTKKKPRRITMPPEFLCFRGTRSETRAGRDAVNTTVAGNKDSQMNGTAETEGKTGYSTRSGRTVRPKRFSTEAELENVSKERGQNKAKDYHKRRRRHSESTTGEKTGECRFSEFLVYILDRRTCGRRL